MNEKDFLEKLEDVLNTEMTLTMDMPLSNVDRWDSLGALGFIGMCFEALGKEVHLKDLAKAQTVRDLYNLL